MPFVKSLVRYSLIAGLAGGAAVVVAGPDRVAALLHQAQNTVHAQIDSVIDDPIALRAQLRALESQYPQRIGEVRSDLAELQRQVAQLERDRDVNARAAQIASADLDTLRSMVAKAESIAGEHNAVVPASYGGDVSGPLVQIRFAGETLSLEDAYSKVSHVQNNTALFEQRAADIDRDLGMLSQQETRLNELLAQLETEQQSFQSQMWQLDRQVDAISRNERMIDMMAKRQDTIERHSRYRADSLEQVHGRLAEIRTKQESQLQSLSKARTSASYEDRAKIEIDREKQDAARASASVEKPVRFNPVRAAKPRVIEITPSDVERGPFEVGPAPQQPVKAESVASGNPA